jgi:uncharacterized membrane protein YgdD (TMEM256/DUF423 family)
MAEPGRKTASAALWLTLAGFSGLVAVAAGAFGAHALAGRVPPADLAAFETGARYQLAHALALIAVAWLADRRAGPPCRAATIACWGFFTGTILFSGSLYVLGLTGSRALVWMTPLGGLALLTGWAALMVAARGLRRTP